MRPHPRASRRPPQRVARCLAAGLFLVAGALEPPDSSAQQVASAAAPNRAREAEDYLVVPRLEGRIELDGRADEAAWDALAPLPAVMMLPDFGASPTERTEFRVAYDEQYLYFSCRAYDSEPGGIQAASLRRDEIGWSSDRCMIYLDTLNDEENSVGFITTPGGVRTEVAHANDGGRWDADWNTFWDVATHQGTDGWSAEFRIPFSSLLFQPDESGRVVMGFSVLRSIPRKNERAVFPAIPPTWGNFSHPKPTQMKKAVFEGLHRTRPLYVTPYSLAGGGYTHALNSTSTAYDRERDRVTEVGLDLKYGLTSNLTLDLTLNTDFAQVEADEQQTNLTRFSLFFPEKRRFFQERNANFDFPLGNDERLFHSRQIGLSRGEPVRIYGGARIVGRVGEWDVGVLNMQTAESEFLPSENQGVVRLRRRVINPYSYVGGILTSRLGTDGSHNLVAGADGIFRVFERDYVTLSTAQGHDSREAVPAGGIDLLDRSLLRLNWSRPGEDDLFYMLDLTRAGQVFEPRMGFLRRRDYTKAEARLGHGWRPEVGTSRWRTYSLAAGGTAFRRNADDVVETVEGEVEAILTTRNTYSFTLTVPLRYENLAQPFALSADAVVPPGIYRFAALRLAYRKPMGSLLQIPVTVQAGRFYDGTQTSFSVRPAWSLSRHLTVGTGYSVDHVEFADREQSFTAHVGHLRTEVMLSNATSALGYVQYNSADDAVVANFRFHYRPREGNDLYVVWNEGLITDRLSRDLEPIRPWSDRRTLLVKYAHTFSPGF